MLSRLAALALLGVLAAACGSPPSTGEDATQPTPSEPSQPEGSPSPSESRTSASAQPTRPDEGPSGTRVRVADSEFGPMLFDTAGQAIYLFDKEEGPRAECYGACAADWPPVLTDGKPQGVQGARQGLLGTTERRDGSLQVTYAGHPLYYYAHEEPGQVLCHDFVEYGGTWYVVQPDGDPAP